MKNISEDNHELHKIIGKVIESNLPEGSRLIKSKECGGEQYIPLYSPINKKDSHNKSSKNKCEYSEVDLLILKDEKVRSIIEIEEANNEPKHICGKFLAPALARFYTHKEEKNKSYPMSDFVTLIQIIDSASIDGDEEKSSKFTQWENLEKSIRDIIPVSGSKVEKYRLLYGYKEDFRDGEEGEKLVRIIQESMK